MILVSGATGTVGRRLIMELRIRKTPFRVLTRDPVKARALLGEVDAVVGDFFDERALKRALADVDAAFLLSPVDPDIPKWEACFARAAKKAGVKRLVKLSALGADAQSHVTLMRWHGEAEVEVRRSGVPFVILRPTAFFQSLERHAANIRRGVLAAPMGEARVAMVNADDVAAVAAAALTRDSFDGETLTLSGPASITYAQIAASLSSVLTRPVSYAAVKPEDAKLAMLEAGMPAWLVEALLGIAALLRSGRGDMVTEGVRLATGRDASGLDEYLRARRAVFA